MLPRPSPAVRAERLCPEWMAHRHVSLHRDAEGEVDAAGLGDQAHRVDQAAHDVREDGLVVGGEQRSAAGTERREINLIGLGIRDIG